MSGFEIFAVTPPSYLVRNQFSDRNEEEQFAPVAASVALAAAAAGHVGIIDLQFVNLDATAAKREVLKCLGTGDKLPGAFGVRCGISQLPAMVAVLSELEKLEAHGQLTLILVADGAKRAKTFNNKSLPKEIARIKNAKVRVLIEVVSSQEAASAEKLEVDGIIAKGHEAAGSVGEQTTFVLLQQCLRLVNMPVFAEGGIGLHTAAACYAAGARGVVLNSQLLLTRESQIPFELKLKIEQMDGTETSTVAVSQEQLFRLYMRPNHPLAESLQVNPGTLESHLAKSRQDDNPLNWILPLGQDVAFAGGLAKRYLSVAGVLDAIESSVYEHVFLAKKNKPLAPHSSLANSHASEFPIVQGAMTRVSDTAEFAFQVAEAGGLPFLALSLMRKGEADRLLSQSQEKLGKLPWGVGILGFVPSQLRQEQLEAIQAYKPPYALIAGGRPDQAKSLEEQGIKTYLHVPSPLLLSSFMEMGSRRFVFEGRECGGHVGPRSSFVLWEAMIERLLENIGPREDPSAYHVLFAGGVHDALSSCMVATMAATLAEKGVKVGALMGTAYLFTKEAVSSGAIVKKFQEAALACRDTVLLETGPGHAIRCIGSPYKKTFDERRKSLLAEGKGRDQVREELELMNLGRLRIASKGLTRGSSLTKDQIITEMASQEPGSDNNQKLQSVSEEKQWSEGMYMIGQVAALNDSVLTVRELHEKVSAGGMALIDALDLQKDAQDLPHVAAADDLPDHSREGIAIIGMACLLPKAKDVETYWQNILNKVDTIEEVPLEQWDWRNYYDSDPQARDKIYSKWGGFLENVEFDPTKYGIPPSSLSSIDPMQIILLEIADAALKDAGYENRPFARERTSVILANAGHGPITALYSLRSMLGWKLSHLNENEKAKILAAMPEWTEDSFPGYLGNVTAGRVANRFDLGGINYSIDAACASSLAGLHSAMAELRNGNSDMVLLSATDTHNQPGDYLSFSKTHAFSANGRCKTFDSQADGIVISEGMAMLVLKRLGDAKRDGDRIYAVVRGIGGSSDGRDLSLTAPRPAGQVKALERAYRDANVPASSITLVEAHGTGTVAGDRAEVDALKRVFEESGAPERSCAIGSVKTMIGHTKAAAGLASIIKVAKALYHKVLPPTIGVKVPNPACHFEKGPFYINSETRPWLIDQPSDQAIRRAGVSAFGFGGTNFHAVLEEYLPESAVASGDSAELPMPAELFLFYGRNPTELLKSLTSLSESIKRVSQEEKESRYGLACLAHACYLKSVEWHSQRVRSKEESEIEPSTNLDQCLSIVASSFSDLEEKLSRAKGELLDRNKSEIKDPRGIYFSLLDKPRSGKIAFVFPGQGSQQVNMLGQLAMQFPEVTQTFESVNQILAGSFAKPLTQYIFPPPSFSEEEEKRNKQELMDTQIAQPAIGAADLAVLKLLGAFGLKPDMVAGHSYGEYVALYAAGCLTLPHLLKISKERGQLLAKASSGVKGTMAAVSTSVNELNGLLGDIKGVTIANINSPTQCVIAGAEQLIEEAVALLKEKGVSAKRISVSQAFHSSQMQGACDDLRRSLQNLTFFEARIPVYSNTEGKVHARGTADIVEKLTEHIVKPVDFVTEIRTMHADGADVFLEVGPGNVLTGLIESILKEEKVLSLAIDRNGRHGVVNLLHVLGQLASCGIRVDLNRLYSFRASLLARHQTQTAMLAQKAASNSKRLLYSVNSVSIKRLDKTTQQASSQVKDSHPNSKQPTAVSNQLSVNPTTVGMTGTNQKATSLPTQEDKVTNTSGPGTATPASQSVPQVRVKQEAFQSNTPARQENAPSPVGAQNLLNKQLPMQAPSLPKLSAGAAGNVDQVLIEFQKTMLQMTNDFLKTQQNVMLAYLQSRSPGAGPRITLPRLADYAGSQIVSNQGLAATGSPNQWTASVGTVTGGQASPNDLRSVDPTGTPADFAPAQTEVPDVVSSSKLNTAEQLPEMASGNGSDNGKDIDPEYLVNSLLDIVSQRTGYPTDMLDPTLDLEADLGIDSIKRVEILNSFRRILPETKQKQLEAGIEELAGTKTLQGIIDWLRSEPIAGDGSLSQSTAITIAEEEGNNGNGKHSDPLSKTELSEIATQVQPSELTLSSSVNLKVPGESYKVAVDGNGNNGSSGNGSNGDHGLEASGTNIRRGLTRVVPLPMLETANLAVSEDSAKLVLITADRYGFSSQVSKVFEDAGLSPVVLKHDRSAAKIATIDKNRRQYQLNMTDPALLAEQLAGLEATFGKTRSLVDLQSLGSSVDGQWSTISDNVLSLFQLIKHLGADLAKRAGESATGIVAVTALGGSFGLERGDLNGIWSTGQASIVGLIKSAQKELANLNCKVVDFEEEAVKAGPDRQLEVARRLVEELCTAEPVVEVSYKGNSRFGLAVEHQVLDSSSLNGSNLNEESVILITGGARGITAEIALELAERYKPLIIVIGRSERPDGPEEDRFVGLQTPREIKGAIIDLLKANGKQVTIPVVEAHYQALMRQREIRTNLEKLEAIGARVEYHSLDVRDREAVGALIKRIYEDHGNINAVVHGAGVIEDAYIKDKSPESFLRVFETKVLGAFNLAETIRLESLDYFFLFSSVVGRTGNAGQSDYVAANEVVNKLALSLASKVRGRASSIMWGPWKGGMAQPELESIFASYGWAMIDANAGRRALVDEILMGKREEVEVLLVAELDKATSLEAKGAKLEKATLRRLNNGDYELSFELNTHNDVFLQDHTFDGVPVMPMAFALEFLSEAVASVYPDREIQFVENLDIPSGIVFETNSKMMFVTVHEEESAGTRVRAVASLSSGISQRRSNFKASFVLDSPATSKQIPGKVAAHLLLDQGMPDVGEATSVPPLSDIYGQWLFHGPIFQGIKEIYAIGSEGVVGSIIGSSVKSCFKNAGDVDWVIDPIMIDSAMQLGGIWARRYLDITVLPTGFRRLHNLARPAQGPLTVWIMMDPESTASELACDLAIYDKNGHIALLIEGLGGVGSKSLNRLSGGGIEIGAGR
jgi:malonyl CoA-acyl carrier protein transacylase